MPKETKFLTRPKVRFSQIPDEEEKTESSKSTASQVTGKLTGPRVRSVVILEKPVTLVRDVKQQHNSSYKQLANLHSVDSQEQEEEEEVQCLTDFPTIPQIIVNESSPAQIEHEEFRHMPGNVQTDKTDKQAFTLVESYDSCERSKVPKVPPLDLPTSEDEKHVRKQKLKVANHGYNSKIHKGKENSKALANSTMKSVNNASKKKVSTHASAISISTQKLKEKLADRTKKSNSSVFETKKVSNGSSLLVCTKDSIRALPKARNTCARKHVAPKPVVTTLMPCHKYNMMLKTKSSTSVKKKVLYNVSGPKIEPYIGPGVLKSIERSNTISKKAKKPILKGQDFSERLYKPEYNSIMCTVGKLQDAKDEEIVTNIECLPSSYKAFINGKVSNALDFPLDEAIYKNLVDLSIDEKQLPARLTRSIDPQPTLKDPVPVLSDFFTPQHTEEYCTPVFVKPRIPNVINNWDPYRISEKILNWKASMDNA